MSIFRKKSNSEPTERAGKIRWNRTTGEFIFSPFDGDKYFARCEPGYITVCVCPESAYREMVGELSKLEVTEEEKAFVSLKTKIRSEAMVMLARILEHKPIR